MVGEIVPQIVFRPLPSEALTLNYSLIGVPIDTYNLSCSQHRQLRHK
jgi:hypothetical protein